MNKNDLINELAAKLNITRTASKKYLEAFEETFGDALEEGEPVMLQGFGTFTLWKQTGRPARNPKTGAPCMIAPRNSVKFKPGKGLLKRLNREEGIVVDIGK